MFTTYILTSQKDHTHYIGHTSDIKQRIINHNSGLSGYTKRKMPWLLVYTKEFETRAEAMNFEKKLKAMKSRKLLNNLINEGPDRSG